METKFKGTIFNDLYIDIFNKISNDKSKYQKYLDFDIEELERKLSDNYQHNQDTILIQEVMKIIENELS